MYADDPAQNHRLSAAIDKCLKMVPQTKPNDFYSNLREKLNAPSTSDTTKKQTRSMSSLKEKNDKLKFEDMFREFSNDLSALNSKFNEFSCMILALLDRTESLELRVEKLEKERRDIEAGQAPTYASAVSQNLNVSNQSERLEKLEFDSSEDERKNRLLQVQITHPSLDLI